MSGGQATGDRGAGGTLSRRGQQPLGLTVLQVDPRGKRGKGYRKGERGATGRGLMVTRQGLVSGWGCPGSSFPSCPVGPNSPGVASLARDWGPQGPGHHSRILGSLLQAVAWTLTRAAPAAAGGTSSRSQSLRSTDARRREELGDELQHFGFPSPQTGEPRDGPF